MASRAREGTAPKLRQVTDLPVVRPGQRSSLRREWYAIWTQRGVMHLCLSVESDDALCKAKARHTQAAVWDSESHVADVDALRRSVKRTGSNNPAERYCRRCALLALEMMGAST